MAKLLNPTISVQSTTNGSALRAASASNPRNLPCPTCKRQTD